MKAIIDFGISVNGMIARENGDEDWLPESGWSEFLEQIEKYGNVIIGRETYELVKEKYEHDNFDAITGVLKIIVTRNKNYRAPDENYIIVHSPEEALEIVAKNNLELAYVGGGGKLAGSFFQGKLVEGLHLTAYPTIIAKGRPFTGGDDFPDVEMELLQVKVDNGRVILDYKVHQ